MLSAFPAPLESPRLVLRAVEPTDLADLAEMNGDDRVTRFLPYASWRTTADGEAWLGRALALNAGDDGVQLVIVERASGRAIGSCLLFRYHHASARAELGYALRRASWGKGLMREALAALITHAFGTLALHRLEAEADLENHASNGILIALGFAREGILRQRWAAKGRRYDTHFYGLLRADWPAVGDA